MWAALKSAFAPVEKRTATRRTTTGTVQIDSRSYPLVNWSATGVLIGGHADHLAKGQKFRMRLEVNDGTEPIAFSCEAVVVRKQGDKLAAQFFQIDKRWKVQLHRYFARHGSEK